MKKIIISIIVVFCCMQTKAQELYVFTEPASNMAAKSIGLRLNNYLMKEPGRYNYHLLPEIMWGVSRKIMVHGEAFLSNRDNSFTAEGGSAYLKYRFFSEDDVHSHFRMAAYGRYSFNNSDIHQPAIDFFGHSSGYEGGLIATKLVNKVAVSASASYLHAKDNSSEKFPYADRQRNAIGYTLSVGKLMLPKEYTNYNQTNLNLMCEFLGQYNTGNKNSYLDIAPSAQLIFDSRMRFDLGYRFPVVKDLYRTAPYGFLIRLEYNIFNAYK
ncbi:MAG: hypothetical protein QM791_14730 [Ferruginibacter sp.]